MKVSSPICVISHWTIPTESPLKWMGGASPSTPSTMSSSSPPSSIATISSVLSFLTPNAPLFPCNPPSSPTPPSLLNLPVPILSPTLPPIVTLFIPCLFSSRPSEIGSPFSAINTQHSRSWMSILISPTGLSTVPANSSSHPRVVAWTPRRAPRSSSCFAGTRVIGWSLPCRWFEHVEICGVHASDDCLPRALAAMLRSNSTVTSLVIDDVSIPAKVSAVIVFRIVAAFASGGAGGE